MQTAVHSHRAIEIKKIFFVMSAAGAGLAVSLGLVWLLQWGYSASVFLPALLNIFSEIPSFAGFLQAWVWLFSFFGALWGGGVYLYYEYYKKNILPFPAPWKEEMKGSLRILLSFILLFTLAFPLVYLGQWILGLGRLAGAGVFGYALGFSALIYVGAFVFLLWYAVRSKKPYPKSFVFGLGLNIGFLLWFGV